MSPWLRPREGTQELRYGLRLGAGLAVAVFVLALSFGTIAVAAGWPGWLVVLMSAIIFAGGAQFALIVAFADGGLLAALGAATLMNLRFVPMGMTAGRAFVGGLWARSLQSQAVVDGSWVIARRPDGSFSLLIMLVASIMQWLAWVGGTAVGAYLTPNPQLVSTLGLDVVFPAFFLMFILDSLKSEPRYRISVVAAALIVGLMCWFVAPGVALVTAAAAAPIALHNSKGTS